MLVNINNPKGGPNMSYQHTIEVLNQYIEDFGPMAGITSFLDCDYDHEGFTVVYLTSGYRDYLKEVDGKLFVLAESDGWTYAVFNSIEDYMNFEFDGCAHPVISDLGYDSFDHCFKSAVFDMLQNPWKFNR